MTWWFWPFRSADDIAHELDALHRRISRLAMDLQAERANAVEWRRYSQELGRLVSFHEREISQLKRAVPQEVQDRLQAVERRAAELALFIHAPISDGREEVSRALEDALAQIGGKA